MRFRSGSCYTNWRDHMGKRHMKAFAIKPRSSQQSVGPSIQLLESC
jgi:hypothetical protein